MKGIKLPLELQAKQTPFAHYLTVRRAAHSSSSVCFLGPLLAWLSSSEASALMLTLTCLAGSCAAWCGARLLVWGLFACVALACVLTSWC